MFTRQRVLTTLSISLIVPVGLYTRFYGGIGESWVRESLGGVFYVIFWCLVVYLILDTARPRVIAMSVLLVTAGLEFLQLWHPPALETLRRSFLGSALLGTTFHWWDFPYYLIGALIAWLWMSRLHGEPRQGEPETLTPRSGVG